MSLYTEIGACRNCGSDHLDEMLDLGNLCISDFVLPGEAEDRAPLMLLQCAGCSLVQLQHTVDRDRLYRDYYYRSGTNESMVKALREVVDDAITRIPFPASRNTVVVDIGSNDGTLLQMYPGQWTRVGFEPSQMGRESESSKELMVFTDFFPPARPWYSYLNVQPKIITSIAMFYDLDDPNNFVAGIKEWLHQDGVWVLQMPSLDQMLANAAFDNICHEHLCYWPLHALMELLHRHGLELEAMSTNDVNGGSTRYIIRHAAVYAKPVKAKWFWQHHMLVFKQNVERLRWETVGLLNRLKGAGKLVLGYGASTKGNTLLQYYGITPDLLPAIADRNPDKWGKMMIGTHIPIISEEAMREMCPNYLLVLPWGFLSSFKQREAGWLDAGGQFIVPLPELRVIGGSQCQSTTAAHFAKL